MKAYALISGRRQRKPHGRGGQNKVFLPIRGIPAIVRADRAVYRHLCERCGHVARPEEIQRMEGIVRQFGLSRFVHTVTPGGDTRQASVYNGLQALPDDADIVLIHDGARALITEDIITRALKSAQERGSGVASVAVHDTIKRVSDAGEVLDTINRDHLRAMQTPAGVSGAADQTGA